MSESDSNMNTTLYKKKHSLKNICCHFCLFFNIILLNVLLFVYVYLDNYNDIPPSNGYPKENTNNYTLGNCQLSDKCKIITVNNTKKLIAEDFYILPTQYKTDDDGTNCPLYWEVPSYFHMRDNCKDLGFGCCKYPIDTECSIRIQFAYDTDPHWTTVLYTKHKKDRRLDVYLDVAKVDQNGTNCPTMNELLYEPLWYNNRIIYLLLRIIVIYFLMYVLYVMFYCYYMIGVKDEDYNIVQSESV